MATRYKNIYFIGIGGIGMSAIARYFKFKGLNVTGYDKTESELTDALQKEEIDVHYEDNTDFIPKDVENTLVVYTPAIPHDMGELVYVQEHGYKVLNAPRSWEKSLTESVASLFREHTAKPRQVH